MEMLKQFFVPCLEKHITHTCIHTNIDTEREREINSKAGLNVLCFAALFSPNHSSDKGVAVPGSPKEAVNQCPML